MRIYNLLASLIILIGFGSFMPIRAQQAQAFADSTWEARADSIMALRSMEEPRILYSTGPTAFDIVGMADYIVWLNRGAVKTASDFHNLDPEDTILYPYYDGSIRIDKVKEWETGGGPYGAIFRLAPTILISNDAVRSYDLALERDRRQAVENAQAVKRSMDEDLAGAIAYRDTAIAKAEQLEAELVGKIGFWTVLVILAIFALGCFLMARRLWQNRREAIREESDRTARVRAFEESQQEIQGLQQEAEAANARAQRARQEVQAMAQTAEQRGENHRTQLQEAREQSQTRFVRQQEQAAQRRQERSPFNGPPMLPNGVPEDSEVALATVRALDTTQGRTDRRLVRVQPFMLVDPTNEPDRVFPVRVQFNDGTTPESDLRNGISVWEATYQPLNDEDEYAELLLHHCGNMVYEIRDGEIQCTRQQIIDAGWELRPVGAIAEYVGEEHDEVVVRDSNTGEVVETQLVQEEQATDPQPVTPEALLSRFVGEELNAAVVIVRNGSRIRIFAQLCSEDVEGANFRNEDGGMTTMTVRGREIPLVESNGA